MRTSISLNARLCVDRVSVCFVSEQLKVNLNQRRTGTTLKVILSLSRSRKQATQSKLSFSSLIEGKSASFVTEGF